MPNKNNHASLPLDLSLAPSVIFFFGMSGAGKSYVGDIIGENSTNCYIYHADEDITDDMVFALQNKQPFTDPIRQTFFALIAEKILDLSQRYDQVIITQGAYKQKHRDYITSRIPGTEMIWIDASKDIIHDRLSHRANGISIESAEALVKDFEPPPPGTKSISNTKDANYIIEQLNYYFSRRSSYNKKLG